MLIREEENLIKRYSVLNTIGVGARFLVVLILAVCLILDMIGVLHYNREATWIIETKMFIGLFLVYCVILLCGIYVPYYGMRRQMWSTLIEKVLEEYKRKNFPGEMAAEMELSRLGDMLLAVGKNKGYAAVREAGPFMEMLERWDRPWHIPFSFAIRAAEVRHDINFAARTFDVKLPQMIIPVFIMAATPMIILATMFINHYII